jgi:hypothetical protein
VGAIEVKDARLSSIWSGMSNALDAEVRRWGGKLRNMSGSAQSRTLFRRASVGAEFAACICGAGGEATSGVSRKSRRGRALGIWERVATKKHVAPYAARFFGLLLGTDRAAPNAASCARVKFTMSDREPSGRLMRHILGQ